jgi:hypothetical protein
VDENLLKAYQMVSLSLGEKAGVRRFGFLRREASKVRKACVGINNDASTFVLVVVLVLVIESSVAQDRIDYDYDDDKDEAIGSRIGRRYRSQVQGTSLPACMALQAGWVGARYSFRISLASR